MGDIDPRFARGIEIARTQLITAISGTLFAVPSQSHAGRYLVDATRRTCLCPDFQSHDAILRVGDDPGARHVCKHLYALDVFQRRISLPDGVEIDGLLMPRRSTRRKRDNGTFNRAQIHEKELVRDLLRELCDLVEDPPCDGKPGRPCLPLGDMIFSATFFAYLTFSMRRAQSDLAECARDGLLRSVPHPNTIWNYLRKPAVTPILVFLVEESAAPFAPHEDTFIGDSTCFGPDKERAWRDHKYGKRSEKDVLGEEEEVVWMKAHTMIAANSKVITGIVVTTDEVGDSPMLPELIRRTHVRFKNMRQVLADRAYLGVENLVAIESVGAAGIIAPKSNSRHRGPPAWERLAERWRDPATFWPTYAQRPLIESSYSAKKQLFDGWVRGDDPVSWTNQILCKCLAYNLTCMTKGIFDKNLEPKFGPDTHFAPTVH